MALTALQRRKLSALFRVFDADNNGVLERADHDIIANNLAAIRGWSLGSPDYDEFTGRLDRLWNALTEHANIAPEGAINEEAWLDYHASTLSQGPVADNVLLRIADTIMQLLDRNGDGQLSCQEFRLFYHVYGIDPAGVEYIFSRLDLDGNGYIDHAELLKHCTDFWTSNDLDAPGNWFFGPF